jgi:cob(I)alamin adenosyltransferase
MNDQTAGRRDDPLAPPERTTTPTGRKTAVPKRKKPGPYRVPPREQRDGLLIVNTGDGKGKTTAALGLLLRATGRGMRVGMLQFVKSLDDAGEHRAAKLLGVDIIPLGAGCTLGRDDTSDGAALARAGWDRCTELLAGGEYDVLILDELTLPIAWGWLDTATVLAAIAARPEGTHVVVTGRHAPEALTSAADLVTDMRSIKHPLRDRGLTAQAGVDV